MVCGDRLNPPRKSERPVQVTGCDFIQYHYGTSTDLKIETALGCTIGKLSPQDLKRLGLPESVGHEKRAILKVPLTFPKPRLRRRA